MHGQYSLTEGRIESRDCEIVKAKKKTESIYDAELDVKQSRSQRRHEGARPLLNHCAPADYRVKQVVMTGCQCRA